MTVTDGYRSTRAHHLFPPCAVREESLASTRWHLLDRVRQDVRPFLIHAAVDPAVPLCRLGWRHPLKEKLLSDLGQEGTELAARASALVLAELGDHERPGADA